MTAAVASAGLVVLLAACARAGRGRRTRRQARGRLVGLPGGRRPRPVSAPGLVAPAWFARALGSTRREPGSADLVWRAWVGAIVALTVGAVAVGGGPAGVVAAVLGLSASPLVARWWRHREGRRLDAQLPAFLDAVASGLRSGSSLSTGVLEAAQRVRPPLRSRLAPVVAGVRAGSPLEVELDAWLGRQASSAVAIVVGALVLGLGAGGPQADTVDAIGDTLRDRLALADEVRALASQARASAVVLVVAPVVFAVVAAVADPTILRFLVGSPAGLGCLVGGTALDAAGAAWMSSITRGDR